MEIFKKSVETEPDRRIDFEELAKSDLPKKLLKASHVNPRVDTGLDRPQYEKKITSFDQTQQYVPTIDIKNENRFVSATFLQNLSDEISLRYGLKDLRLSRAINPSLV